MCWNCWAHSANYLWQLWGVGFVPKTSKINLNVMITCQATTSPKASIVNFVQSALHHLLYLNGTSKLNMKKPRYLITIAEFVLKLFQTSWNEMSTCQVTPKLNPLTANIVTKHLHPLYKLKGGTWKLYGQHNIFNALSVNTGARKTSN